jgi:Peptidase MA superfamily
VPGGVGLGRSREGAGSVLAVLLLFFALQGPERADVGRVTAVFWPRNAAEALANAEFADRAATWPGITAPSEYRIRMVVAPSANVFDSITQGRLPGWGGGVAFPGTNTIVIIAGRESRQTLRHELAHLALRNAVPRGAPRWFEEGYASVAAGEWNRLDVLRVNWALARGRIPTLLDISRDLRGGAARAEAGYALATTAVLLLQRMGGDRGLAPIVAALAAEGDMDRALRRAHGLTLDQFEEGWRRDLKKRYGWVLLGTSFVILWSVVALLVVVVWARRRHSNRIRKEALDVGWIIGDADDPTS